MHAPDGTVIRGPERRQSPRTVGKPGLRFPSQLLEYTERMSRDSFPLSNINKTSSYGYFDWGFDCKLLVSRIMVYYLDQPIPEDGDSSSTGRDPLWNLVFSTQSPITTNSSGVTYEGEWATTAITFTFEQSTPSRSETIPPRIICL